MTLVSDLRAVRKWIEVNTYCALQTRNGWFVKDCVEAKERRKCERCRMLGRLDRQLAAPPALDAQIARARKRASA